MKILYHAINGTGLGHLMRLSAIGEAVGAHCHEVHQTFVTQAPLADYLKRRGFPAVILPAEAGGPFDGLDLRRRSVGRRASVRLLYFVIEAVAPDLIVFDTHYSIRLAATLAAEGRAMALVLRKCRPDQVRRQLAEGRLDLFARILVPHDEAEWRQGLPTDLAGAIEALPNVRFVGPIARVPSAATEVADEYWPDAGPASKRLLICCGGGGYRSTTDPFLARLRQAAGELMKAAPEWQALVVSGPYGPTIAPAPGLRCIRWVDDLPALMARADLVVAQAGYNTVCELAAAGAPAVLCPADRRHDDQRLRAETAGAHGRAYSLVDPDMPLDALVAVLARTAEGPRPAPLLPRGAAVAAAELLSLLSMPRVARLHWDDDGPLDGAEAAVVHLGAAAAPEILMKRAEGTLARLAGLGLPAPQVTLVLEDATGGTVWAEVAARLEGRALAGLVGEVPGADLPDALRIRAEAWERVRQEVTTFSADLTLQTAPIHRMPLP